MAVSCESARLKVGIATGAAWRRLVVREVFRSVDVFVTFHVAERQTLLRLTEPRAHPHDQMGLRWLQPARYVCGTI
jgi:hypothetical protein